MRTVARIVVAAAVLTIAGAGALGGFVWLNRYVPPQQQRALSPIEVQPTADDFSWTSYGGDPGQTRHSGIRQITTENVGHLEVAWTYRTGELQRRGRWAQYGRFQATPILAIGNLVFCTPFSRVIALNPATGAELWAYEPDLRFPEEVPGEDFNCRGLAQWRDVEADEGAACRDRLFVATTDRRIIALDAASGDPCANFGEQGQVRVGLNRPELREWELQFTSAPAVVGDVVVLGSASGDNGRTFGPEGTVRAFNARTGVEEWRFDPIPRGFDPVASPTWEGDSAATTGQANVWGSITVDTGRDLVFLPTSSPSPDFYGGKRRGANLYANSVVALRGSTGEVVWHFQTVHHDLWDYDVPAGPSLITFRRDGRAVAALVFATKTGFLFVLDRETGEPLTPVEERPVPRSDVDGEWASPTQPFSIGQPILVPHSVNEEDAFGLMVWDKIACRNAIRSASRNEGIFTPPSTDGGTLLVPFGGGGANWGGVAVEPGTNRIFINTSRAINRVTLFPAEEVERRRAAEPDMEISPMRGAPYGMRRELLTSPLDMLCNSPPWGALAAVDLEAGEMAWETALGNTKELAPFGMAFPFGTPNFGGPLVTAGGLVFIGATMDNLLRAFDARTGAELWAGDLPNGGQATPMTYAVGGRQYVVIAAGGHPSLGIEIGEALVAFALPE
jgi:quinoprotein glucose dehydrogenase